METGVCGDSEENEMEVIDLNPKKKIDIYYVTLLGNRTNFTSFYRRVWTLF